MVLNMIITKRKKFLISWDVDYLIQYILSAFETFSFFENVIMEPHCALLATLDWGKQINFWSLFSHRVTAGN